MNLALGNVDVDFVNKEKMRVLIARELIDVNKQLYMATAVDYPQRMACALLPYKYKSKRLRPMTV